MNRVVSAGLALVVFTGCKGGPIDKDDIPSDAVTGGLVVTLGGDGTAAAGDEDELDSSIEEVWLRIDQVEVEHEEEGWIIVSDERRDVDLMALRDGTTQRIGGGEVYEGAYDQMRFLITDSWVLADGAEHDLGVPEELELDAAYYVDEDTTTSLWVGWDLDVELQGSGDNWSLGTNVDLEIDLDVPDEPIEE